MGIVDGLLGHGGVADAGAANQEYARLMGAGEAIEHAYKLVRDMFLFTNRRLILVDKQGITGKKVEYLSVPYKSITRFAVETAGTFDLDAELRIWTAGVDAPLEKQFNKSVDIYQLQALLARYICG